MVKGKKNPIKVYTPSYRTSSLYENYSRRIVPADVVASGNYTQSMSSIASVQSLPPSSSFHAGRATSRSPVRQDSTLGTQKQTKKAGDLPPASIGESFKECAEELQKATKRLANDGKGGVIILKGQKGVGKTTLLSKAVVDVKVRGSKMGEASASSANGAAKHKSFERIANCKRITASGNPFESGPLVRPFGVFVDILNSLLMRSATVLQGQNLKRKLGMKSLVTQNHFFTSIAEKVLALSDIDEEVSYRV